MPKFQIGPLELLIFQGTPFCNIDCKYCYLPDRQLKGRMDLDIVRQTIHTLVKENVIRDHFTVLWHAGEPMVLPIEYYEEAIHIIRSGVPADYHIRFAFQTNGILINDRWCQFFKKYDIEVGLSIDGPEFIHDRNRITRSGKGTFSKVMNGVRLICEFDLKLEIISVVTDFSCDYPDRMYEFLREIDADSVSFNVEEVVGSNTKSSFGMDSKTRVKNFLHTIFQLNLRDEEPLQIREYDWAKGAVLNSKLNPKDLIFGQITGPFKTVTVNKDGGFSTFSPELNGQNSIRYHDFILGNVLSDSFIQATTTKKFKLIYGDLIKGLQKCKKNCGYYGLCPGGLPSTKFSEHQTLDVDETMYCQLGLQAPIDTLLDMVGKDQLVSSISHQ